MPSSPHLASALRLSAGTARDPDPRANHRAQLPLAGRGRETITNGRLSQQTAPLITRGGKKGEAADNGDGRCCGFHSHPFAPFRWIRFVAALLPRGGGRRRGGTYVPVALGSSGGVEGCTRAKLR